MATVNLSTARKDIIIGNLRAPFKKRAEALMKTITDVLGDQVYELVYTAELLKHMQGVMQNSTHFGNEAVFKAAGNLTVRFYKENFPELHQEKHNVTFNLSTSRIVISHGWYTADAVMQPEYRDHPVVVKIVNTLNERDTIIKEENKLAESMRALLDKCTTLRQAMEVWPTVLNYIDEEMRKTHNKANIARTKAIKEEVTISDDTKMALMKVNMLNGS